MLFNARLSGTLSILAISSGTARAYTLLVGLANDLFRQSSEEPGHPAGQWQDLLPTDALLQESFGREVLCEVSEQVEHVPIHPLCSIPTLRSSILNTTSLVHRIAPVANFRRAGQVHVLRTTVLQIAYFSGMPPAKHKILMYQCVLWKNTY